MLRVLRELALTVGAIAGTLCLVLALLGATADIQPLVFTSGSMAPAIRTGDLAITRPVELADVSPGDVVSVPDGRGMRVTHRVIEVDHARNLLRLKGDANAVADPLPYPADRVDRVLFAVTAGGYLVSRLDSPPAMLLLGAYLAFLLWTLRPRGSSPIEPPHQSTGGRRRTARHRVGSMIGAGLVLGLVATCLPQPTPTLAAWTDAVPVTGTNLTAYTVPKPAITGCSVPLLSLSVTVSFSTVSTPYPLTYRATVVETGQELPVVGTGTIRTATYTTIRQAVLGTHRVRITAELPSTPSWTSTAADQTVLLPLLGLFYPTCGAAG